MISRGVIYIVDSSWLKSRSWAKRISRLQVNWYLPYIHIVGKRVFCKPCRILPSAVKVFYWYYIGFSDKIIIVFYLLFVFQRTAVHSYFVRQILFVGLIGSNDWWTNSGVFLVDIHHSAIFVYFSRSHYRLFVFPLLGFSRSGRRETGRNLWVFKFLRVVKEWKGKTIVKLDS